MIAAQFEIGLGMVKHFFIKLDDIHVATFVIGMAGMALALGDIINPAMKIAFSLDVLINLLVAIAAQFALFAFIEDLVAFSTFTLEAGVSFDQFARHDEAFQAFGGTNRSKRHATIKAGRKRGESA